MGSMRGCSVGGSCAGADVGVGGDAGSGDAAGGIVSTSGAVGGGTALADVLSAGISSRALLRAYER